MVKSLKGCIFVSLEEPIMSSVSSIIKYFRNLPLSYNMDKLNTPISFVDKRLPSVKERFNRLRSKLEREVQNPQAVKVDPTTKVTRGKGAITKTRGKKNSSSNASADGPIITRKRDDELRKHVHKNKFEENVSKPPANVVRKRKFVISDSDEAVGASHNKKGNHLFSAKRDQPQISKTRDSPRKRIDNEEISTKCDTFKKTPISVSERMKKLRQQVESEALIKTKQVTREKLSAKHKLKVTKTVPRSPNKNVSRSPRKPSSINGFDATPTSNLEDSTGFSEKLRTKYTIPKKPPNFLKDELGQCSGLQSTPTSYESRVVNLPSIANFEEELVVEAMDIETASSHCSSPLSANTVEEMDWEVNNLRKDMVDGKVSSFLPGAVEKSSDDGWTAVAEGGQWVLVIDTNVYISALPFVKRILDTEVEGLGYPVIYVPHRVFNELDSLKDTKRQNKNNDLATNSRAAVHYLNSCLSQNPRVKGQTLKQYRNMQDQCIQDGDDKILLSCIQLRKLEKELPRKRLILLSNDTNLRNKAIVENVETYSVQEFKKHILNSDKKNNVREMNKNLLQFRTKTVVKSVLKQILEAECKETSELNSLENTVSAFIRHWPSQFSLSLPVPAEEQLQRLREVIESDTNEVRGAFLSLIDTVKQFLVYFYVKGKPYYNSIKKTLLQLDILRSRALEFYELPVEEKYYNGELEGFFRDCWAALESEIAKINHAREAGDVSYKTRSNSVAECLRRIVDSLGDVLKYSIFDVGNSPALHSLAAALAGCSNRSVEDLLTVLKKGCTTEQGRDLVCKAEKVFSQELDKITWYINSPSVLT